MCIDKTIINKADKNTKNYVIQKADCYWNSIGFHNANADDNFERGYCNKINTDQIDKIIDMVHKKEINNLVKVKELEERHQ